MDILGIESSCDETAAAVVRDGHQVLSSVISSQVAKHAAYGGVIPELAAREHLRAIDPIVREALAEAKIEIEELDAIAVTAAPGLLPALLVGISYAKGLAATLDTPLLGVDHMLAHVYGAVLDHPDLLANPDAYPLLALIVSGGHTILLQIQADGACRLLGQTIDDAAGEAFDKAAKILHLGYPGGPLIDKLAAQGNPTAIDFPRGLTGSGGSPLKPEHRYNFSYSGLKTSLLYSVRQDPTGDDTLREFTDQDFLDIVASYQEAVVDVLVRKTRWAIEEQGAGTVLLCGGVACNSRLRTLITEMTDECDVPLRIAPPAYCTDNAAMIAGLAWHQHRAGEHATWSLDATPRFKPPDYISFAHAGA